MAPGLPAPSVRVAAACSVPSARIVGLDAARALAVVAMVFGHSMDAVISPVAREVPWVKTYWTFRTFTAPLFLFVSGWVLFRVLERRGLTGGAVFRAYLPRVGLLWGLGYAVRFPFWGLDRLWALDRELWRYATTFDALQCIGASMGVLLVLCAVVPGRGARLGMLGVMAVGVVGSAEGVWGALGREGVWPLWPQTFGGGDARFPLFPWAAYFFAGAGLGALFGSILSRWVRVFGMMGLGALLYLGTSSPGVELLADSEPVKVLWRLGPVMALVGLVFSLPESVCHKVAPVGRASLWTYVVHLPVAYGWGYWPGLSTRVGPTLSAGAALAVAAAVVVGSVSAAVLAKRFLGLSKWSSLWIRARPWMSVLSLALRGRIPHGAVSGLPSVE